MGRDLSEQQEAESDRLYEALKEPFLAEARRLARLLAGKEDGQQLGRTEFEVRAGVHRLGVQALVAALEQRKKGGIRGPA
jgi:hypothetical protein